MRVNASLSLVAFADAGAVSAGPSQAPRTGTRAAASVSAMPRRSAPCGWMWRRRSGAMPASSARRCRSISVSARRSDDIELRLRQTGAPPVRLARRAGADAGVAALLAGPALSTPARRTRAFWPGCCKPCCPMPGARCASAASRARCPRARPSAKSALPMTRASGPRCRDVVIDWNRGALLERQIEVNELSAQRIDIHRAPATGGDDALPSATARGEFSLPELPVSLRVGAVRADLVHLDASVLGQMAEVTLLGSAQLAGGQGETRFDAHRVDGTEGVFRVLGAFDNASRVLTLDMTLDEGPRGDRRQPAGHSRAPGAGPDGAGHRADQHLCRRYRGVQRRRAAHCRAFRAGRRDTGNRSARRRRLCARGDGRSAPAAGRRPAPVLWRGLQPARLGPALGRGRDHPARTGDHHRRDDAGRFGGDQRPRPAASGGLAGADRP